jgi:prefoldin subunit 5
MGNSAGESAPEPGTGRRDAKVPANPAQVRGPSQSSFAYLTFEDPPAARRDRPWAERLFHYTSHAALAVCLFGFAWAAGSYVSGGRSPVQVLHSLLPAGDPRRESAERAELIRNVQKMEGEVRSLQTSIDSLRSAQAQAAKGIASLEGLNARLESVKYETGTAIATLSGKVDRIQREPEAKLSQVIDRLDRMEHQLAAPPPPPQPSKPPQVSAASAKPADDIDAPKKPRLITNWIVREVYDGTALVESPRGAIEVAPGEMIPGAGRVKSIERRGSGWIVITSEGIVDSVRDRFEP